MKASKVRLKIVLAVWVLALGVLPSANAGDYRFGASLGFGGGGFSEARTIEGTETLVQRSEGPGVISIYMDWLRTDTASWSVEHARGFRFSPFSTGVSFTGATHRWYFLGPAPAGRAPASESIPQILIKRWAPFAGLAGGVAFAEVSRSGGDLAPLGTGSGIYGGIKAGADYALGSGRFLRPELVYNTTLTQSPSEPTIVNMFSLQCGLHVQF